MLAFLRKSIERSDEAVTPEERLLERRLVEGILKREQKEKESGKKYSKKDKSKKKSKPASLLATSKSNLSSKALDSFSSAASDDGLVRSFSEMSSATSGDDAEGLLTGPGSGSFDVADSAAPSAANTPKASSVLVKQGSKGTPDILLSMQENAFKQAASKSTLGAAGEGALITVIDEASETTATEETSLFTEKKDDVSLSSSQQGQSVHSGTSLLAELPPELLRRYFGKPAKETFFSRFHWLAAQYRKLNLPGELPEFVFENLDDPGEEYFFSRGDADVEEKLGNPSTALIEEFESKFKAKGDSDSEHNGIKSGEVSPLGSPLLSGSRKGSRVFSFDSFPTTPITAPGGFDKKTSFSSTKLPSLHSFSSDAPENPEVVEKPGGGRDVSDVEELGLAKSPWDSKEHRLVAARYSMHSKSGALSGGGGSNSFHGSMSCPKLSVQQQSFSRSGDDTLPSLQAKSDGKNLNRVLESASFSPKLVTKLPSLQTKRSTFMDLSTETSFSLGTSNSLKRVIPEEDFFTSQFIGDCNGLQAPVSPRSKYILGCLSKGLTPKASLVVRKMLTRSLNLQHQGIGDEMAGLLADSLKNLPCLEEINLEDNNLSDDGMGPILQALAQVRTLKNLNLASNEIGGVAAEELGNYLVREDCPLQTLVLHHADVDDFEGERFVNALAGNTSLTEVDLSFNKIGSAENLNTVYPDLVTATEAMAELLTQPGCPLKSLKLTWNMMRLDSAVQFAQALAVNESLTFLDVSYNAFGNDAGCALGDALLDNKTIRTLLISNNGIDSKACFTICIGIQENLGLTKCNMDGNPIGEAGAKALMVLPSVVGTRVNVSANNCNTNIRDPTFWFDQNYPCAEYELHLNDPFERAVCYMLLGLVACHQTLIISRVYFESMVRGQKKIEKLDLIQETFTDKCKFLDENQLAVLQNLYALQAAANNTEEAVALFHKYDADESGALDKGELKLVLEDFGMMVDDDKIDDFIQTYDVDGEGLIELPEFLSFVKSQHTEAAMRIRDMTENMGMALASSPDCKFAPAREGIIRFEVIDSFVKKAKYQVISSSDGTNLTDVAKKTGDVAKLLSYGFQNSKIRLSEALDLYTTMLGEGGEKFKTVAKLLPQIESADEARLFITRVTKNDRVEISRVKIAMGNALWPIIGLPNGYYMLDLSRDMDRICLARLLELSNTRKFHNMSGSKLGYGIVGDTSQYGTWSSFRNEMLNDERVEINTRMFTPMPKAGKLHFDFATSERVPDDAVIMTDARFLKVLSNMCLIESPEDMSALSRLAVMKKEAKRTLGGTGITVFEATMDNAMQTALDVSQFYNDLINRDVTYAEAAKNEEIKVSFNSSTNSPWGSRPSSKASSRPLSKAGSRLGSTGNIKLGGVESSRMNRSASLPFGQAASIECDSLFDHEELSMDITSPVDTGLQGLPKSMSMPVALGARGPSPGTASDNRESVKNALKVLLDSVDIAPEAKAARLVEVVEEQLGPQYIRARHLALIMEKFPAECCVEKVPGFSTYRVDIVVSLFPRIKDLHNFEFILRVLKPHEHAFLYCRLGRLNLFNPMKPEGALELNMSLFEERQIAKILVVLSVIEPGDNFIGAKFRWDRESPFIPGWDVTQPWTTEEGLSRKGFFSVQYYCGNGKNKNGCKADTIWRKCLMQMTLVKETDVIDEDEEQKIPREERPRVGEELMLGKAKERWLSYLTPNAEELKKLRDEIRRAKEEEDRKNGVVKRFRPKKKNK